MTDQRCDWCGDLSAELRADFMVGAVTPRYRSISGRLLSMSYPRGAWGACTPCALAVMTGNAAGLASRVLARWAELDDEQLITHDELTSRYAQLLEALEAPAPEPA